jgi:hypothetical protein
VVSFTAEPTPALASGSEPMTDSVAGAMVMPMPRASSIIRQTMFQYGVSTWSWVQSRSASATKKRPLATTFFDPIFSTSRDELGATTMSVRARGSWYTPVFWAE